MSQSNDSNENGHKLIFVEIKENITRNYLIKSQFIRTYFNPLLLLLNTKKYNAYKKIVFQFLFFSI